MCKFPTTMYRENMTYRGTGDKIPSTSTATVTIKKTRYICKFPTTMYRENMKYRGTCDKIRSTSTYGYRNNKKNAVHV